MNLDLKTLRDDFNQTGFAIVPNLFKRDEVQQLKSECIDILETVQKETGSVAGHGVHVGLAARSSVFQEAVADERLLDILAEILSPDIEFLSDKVVFKNDSMTFASPWHQDWSYWYGAHKYSIWVALDDATVENGCLKLFPGSHKSAIVHDGDANDGHGFGNRLKPEAVDETKAITAENRSRGVQSFFMISHSIQVTRTAQEQNVGSGSQHIVMQKLKTMNIHGQSQRKSYAVKRVIFNSYCVFYFNE